MDAIFGARMTHRRVSNVFAIGIHYKSLHRDIVTVRISAAYRDKLRDRDQKSDPAEPSQYYEASLRLGPRHTER